MSLVGPRLEDTSHSTGDEVAGGPSSATLLKPRFFKVGRVPRREKKGGTLSAAKRVKDEAPETLLGDTRQSRGKESTLEKNPSPPLKGIGDRG